MTNEEAIKELSVTYLGDSERIIEAKKMAIKALEQEPKTGHWIMVHPLQEDDGGAYLCSECKMGNWENIGEWKYCPNCGAKMESEDKE